MHALNSSALCDILNNNSASHRARVHERAFAPCNYEHRGNWETDILKKIANHLNEKSPSSLRRRALKFCGTNWDRTSDTRIFSPLLYHLSYGTSVLGMQM